MSHILFIASGPWLAAIWIISAVLTYALVLGSLTADYPYFRFQAIALVISLPGLIAGPFGIAALLATFWLSKRPIAFRLLPLSTEERWAAHQKAFPNLGREYFH